MTHSLLWLQTRRALGLGIQEAKAVLGESPDGIATALAEVSPTTLGRFIAEVDRAYRESESARKRLSHALNLSSSELRDSNHELEQQAGDLSVLHELTRFAQDHDDLEHVLMACLRTMRIHQHFDAAHALIPDDHGEILVSSGLWSRDEQNLEATATLLAFRGGQHVRRGEGPAGQAWRDNQPVVAESTAADARPYATVLAIPVGIPDHTLAVIELFAMTPKKADLRMLALATDLGRQVGQTLARRQAELSRDLLAEQFRQSQKMEAIGQLAAGIAHDFNNLLTAIFGYGESLLESIPESDRRHAAAEGILKTAERAKDLTQQLLSFGRRQVLAPKPIDLNTVVQSMTGMLERLIGENIKLTTVLAQELPWILADPGPLGQILLNLVVNARDAMPDGGRLRVETRSVNQATLRDDYAPADANHEWVCLTVRDSGHGMSAETAARVFEPFFTTKPKGQGTGLGLSTVYGIAHQSGGRIKVESELGTGTAFHVYLPIATVDVPGSAIKGASLVSLSAGGTETILLVEDDDKIRHLLRETLRGRGYAVLEARSGKDASDLIRCYSARLDAIVTDVGLPDSNGYEVAKLAREHHPAISVLYISGYTHLEVDHADLNAAALSKPFTPSTLCHSLRALLDGEVAVASY